MNWRAQPRQPFIGLAIAAALGILLADFFPSFAVAGATIFVAAIFALRWPKSLFTYLLVAFAFFALHSAQVIDEPSRKLAGRLGDRARSVTVVGTAISEPKLNKNDFSTFLLQLDSVEVEGQVEPSNATVRVRWKNAPRFGDHLVVSGLAEPIPPARNPGVFDQRGYLARRGVRTEIFARYPEDGAILERGGPLILRAAQRSRAWIQSVITRGLNDAPEVQSLVSGMALGIRHEAPEDIEEPFQQTGTLHLFAVAGLHVGIVARLLWIAALMLRLPRKWAITLIIPALLFYAAITGLHVSSVRAAVMASVLLAGIWTERKVFTLNTLAGAGFVLLLLDPNELYSTGFQLSFAVVGAIILCANSIFRWLLRWSEPDPFLPPILLGPIQRAWRYCYRLGARGASVSAAAWIGSLPLIAWYLHLITPVSLFANLVVVPIAFCMLAVALLSLLAAPVSTGLSLLFNQANFALGHLVLAAVHGFAQIPGGHYYIEHPRWPDGARAEIAVLDAGAGAATHLRAGHQNWLIDTGSQRDYESFVREYLRARGINRLDGLMLSHGDSLHIGGAGNVIADFLPATIYDNAAPDRSRIHRALIETLSTRSFHPVVAGAQIPLARRTMARILFPPRGFAARIADDETLVMQLIIDGKFRVLLPSDSGYETERALLTQGADLRSDILIKGQHHSGESGSSEFLAAVQPRLIVATSREFPSRERLPDVWVEMVKAKGIKLFRQDETGAVDLKFYRDRWEATSFITHETFRSDAR